MFSLTIEKNVLRAIVQMAAKQDIRYYLNGVCIEAGATESRLVATDGHILGVIKGPAPDWGAKGFAEVEQVIIPRDAIDKLKRPGVKDPVGIIIHADPVAFTFNLVDGDQQTAGKLIDGKFPDYRRVLPKKITGIASHFGIPLLARFQKAADILIDDSKKFGRIAIGHNGKTGDMREDGGGSNQYCVESKLCRCDYAHATR